MKDKPYPVLCYRCEWRARFMETGVGPRAECKSPDLAVHICYMYSPVDPIVVKKVEGDTRSTIGGLAGARIQGVEIQGGL